MKNIKHTLMVIFAGFAASLSAQSYCDSLSLTSTTVNTQIQGVDFDFHNSGNYMMSYPVLDLTLTANPYLAGGSIVNTLLNPVSFNGGNTTLYVMCSMFTPAAQVPLNTLFTGTLTLLDPNDSSTFCTYQVSFTYGTMAVSGTGSGFEAGSFSIFPNPCSEKATITVSQELLVQQPVAEVYNATGQLISAVIITEKQMTIPLSDQPSGIYFCVLKTKENPIATWKLAVNH